MARTRRQLISPVTALTQQLLELPLTTAEAIIDVVLGVLAHRRAQVAAVVPENPATVESIPVAKKPAPLRVVPKQNRRKKPTVAVATPAVPAPVAEPAAPPAAPKKRGRKSNAERAAQAAAAPTNGAELATTLPPMQTEEFPIELPEQVPTDARPATD